MWVIQARRHPAEVGSWWERLHPEVQHCLLTSTSACQPRRCYTEDLRVTPEEGEQPPYGPELPVKPLKPQ